VTLPEIETPRLVLRLAQPGLEGPMARFLADNFPGHLDRWSPPVPQAMFTEAFWDERLALAADELLADRAVRFVLQPAGTPVGGAIVGTANYTNIVRGAVQACHLGYQIGRAQQGQGLMREALRAANDFMFDSMRLHRIMANFRPENDRSRRLAAALGFVEEGLAKDYLYIDGAWRDHVLTSLVNPRFDAAWLEA
jgi:ribosomal-protein-alanine N-acetyltransferase